MAIASRHPCPDLSTEPAGIEAFELLRRLETPDARFGRAGGPEREPARLGQSARLGFAAADVAEHVPGTEGSPDRVSLNIVGLLGPEGPMPLHLTRWVLERQSNRWFAGGVEGATSDTAFLDFANMLQHRLIALYWRAWADARPEVEFAHVPSGRFPAMLRALAGTGLSRHPADDHAREAAKVRHATSLAQAVQGPERLLSYLSDVASAPVHLVEFVGTWTDVPTVLQTRLGCAHSQLGRSTLIGSRVYERQATAELRVGPMPLDGFLAHLDDATVRCELRHAILFAMGQELAFDLRLVLAADAVPEARLGSCRLGRTTWLDPVPGRDADDLRISRFSQREAA